MCVLLMVRVFMIIYLTLLYFINTEFRGEAPKWHGCFLTTPKGQSRANDQICKYVENNRSQHYFGGAQHLEELGHTLQYSRPTPDYT